MDRPLNDRGRKEAPIVGKAMRKLGYIPDRILCSPSVRTRQTLERLLEKLGADPPVEFRSSLYLASAGTMVEQIAGQADGDSVLLVGHNPGLEDLAGRLSGGGRLRLPTSALAVFEFDVDDWRDVAQVSGDLVCLFTAKALDAL